MNPGVSLGRAPVLSAAEERLKQQFVTGLDRRWDEPCLLADVRDALDEAFGDDAKREMPSELSEEWFFEDGLDVSVSRHPRFLPAFEHSHTFIEISCLVSGTCTNYIAGADLQMSSHDICMIPPGVRHAVSAFADDSVLLNIIVRPAVVRTSLASVDEPGPLFRFSGKSGPTPTPSAHVFPAEAQSQHVGELISMAYEECESERPYKNTTLNALATALLVSLFRDRATGQGTVVADRITPTILAYVRQNLTTASLAGLASSIGYSERQTQRVLSMHFETSFSQLLQRLRMERAAELLESTSLPIHDIGREVGYADIGNFRRMFKRHLNSTPSGRRARSANR